MKLMKIIFTLLFTSTIIAFGQTHVQKIWDDPYKPELEWSYPITALTFSSDSTKIAVVAYKYPDVMIRNVADGTFLKNMDNCEPSFSTVSFSPDDKYVVAAFDTSDAEGYEMSYVRIYDIEKDPFGGTEKRLGYGAIAKFSPKMFAPKEYLVAAATKYIFFFTVKNVYNAFGTYDLKMTLTNQFTPFENRTSENRLMKYISSLDFSPDGKHLAFGMENGNIHLLNCEDMNNTFIVKDFQGQNGRILALSYSPDGKMLASGSEEGRLIVYDVNSAQPIFITEFDHPVTSVSFSKDCKLLLTCSGTIKFWKVSNWELLYDWQQGLFPFNIIAVAPNGKYFAYGRSKLMVGVAYFPVWIEEINQDNATVTLKWNGGSGLYQVQACSDLLTNNWQNLGEPTTNKFFIHSTTNTLFYRVLSLSNTNGN